MHGYLDGLVEGQTKLQLARLREAEWAEYARPLWAQAGH
jgi:hypothetical protein